MEDITGALTVKDVVTRVRQRPVLAVAPMMLGLLLSVAYVVLTPPTYSATASVKVEPVVADRYAGNINVSNIISMQTEMQVVQSTSVAALAADTLGIDMRTVRHSIAVSSPQDTQVVDITYSAGSPAAAVRGAATVADSYLTYSKQSKQAVAKTQYAEVLKNIDEVQKQIAVKSTTALQTQLDVLVQSRRSLESLLANTAGEIINKPVEPTSPASPKPLVAIPAGLGLGAILGLALAVLWPARSRRRLTAPVPPRASGAVAPQHGRPAAGVVPAVVPARPVARPGTTVTSRTPTGGAPGATVRQG